ncbi:MAG: replicative DNA helicase [Candidatus Cloacimonetes bacterium]|jgi:replicative DNA helicase|nr:replicative DNA helicase [Candidatus Cloacimonadota bacterium]MDD4155687.1 replicative DNA helicase [Candidatus Cloacimonadota bacterium]
MQESLERTLPSDVNAETAVLSAMMIDNYSVAKGIEIVQEHHFYKTAHRIIFRCITDLFNDNIEVDIITITNRLEDTGQLEKIGGRAYINELSDIVLSSANIEFHANIVLEKALLRELINASNLIVKKCYNPENPAEYIVDWAEQLIFKISDMPNKKTFMKISDLVPSTLEHIEEIAKTKTSVLGVPSGFTDLDKKIGGLRPGQLVILAARPAMGKTSFALNIAFNAAMFHDMKIAIFTLEMANEELLLRLLSSSAEIPMETLLKGYGMDQEKIVRITQYADILSQKEIYIDDNGANTVMDIRAKTRRLKAEIKGLDLIIIDYLQLMTSKRPGENRQQEISEISRSLKILAKELEVPVIALSQLNRGLESRDDKRPKLSDLRESGAIEQDADIVMFLYRDDYYNKDTTIPGITEVIIGKNRHGSVGAIELKFVSEFTQFKNKENENF